jgi:RHS repeat-associated protein
MADDRAFAYDAADNMIYNSGLCAGSAANLNILYPTTVGSPRPHAPTSICGSPVIYDLNGNIMSYDVDGSAGPIAARSFVYDGENRPLTVTQSGSVTRFAYGPDGSRTLKVLGAATRHFFSGDELLIDSANPAGLLTRYLHADIRREGTATDYLLKDHKTSNRLTQRHGLPAITRHDYSAYGHPLTSNGAQIPQGKAYINERFDPETGLMYLNARYYDGLFGRFLTPDWWDSMLAGVDINRYAYSSNDPINQSDKNGHSSQTAEEKQERFEARQRAIEETRRRAEAERFRKEWDKYQDLLRCKGMCHGYQAEWRRPMTPKEALVLEGISLAVTFCHRLGMRVTACPTQVFEVRTGCP